MHKEFSVFYLLSRKAYNTQHLSDSFLLLTELKFPLSEPQHTPFSALFMILVLIFISGFIFVYARVKIIGTLTKALIF